MPWPTFIKKNFDVRGKGKIRKTRNAAVNPNCGGERKKEERGTTPSWRNDCVG